MNAVASFSPLLHFHRAGLAASESQSIRPAFSEVLFTKFFLLVFIFVCVRSAQLLSVDDDDGVHVVVVGFAGHSKDYGVFAWLRAGRRTFSSARRCKKRWRQQQGGQQEYSGTIRKKIMSGCHSWSVL